MEKNSEKEKPESVCARAAKSRSGYVGVDTVREMSEVLKKQNSHCPSNET